MRTGELSAREVAIHHLDRTEALQPQLNAFTHIDRDGALRRATAVDEQLAAGADPGPLAGVPVAVKDNLCLAGRRLSCGSRLLEGFVAPYTATAVERLIDAGAVIVGRTNMDEFAMGSSGENSAFCPTRNPRRRDRVPGGSSAGSAAAVAAGAVPLALGSDTGGSVRQPAAFCGVVGLRPTWGRVSRHGLVAFASSLDSIGPLARRVRDAALCLRVIAGPDRHDSTCSAEPAPDPEAGIEEGIEGLRIGVPGELAALELEPGARRGWERALRELERLGGEVREVSVPALASAVAAYYLIATSEASSNLARFDGVRFGRRQGGDDDLAELYLESRGRGLGTEVKRRIVLGTFALSAGYHRAYYGRACATRELLKRELTAALDEVDALATPTCPGGAFRLGERVDDPLRMYLSDAFTVPASLAGLPAVSVPAGSDPEGLPLGLQIIGRRFEESMVLRIARAVERTGDRPQESVPPRVDGGSAG